MPALARRDMVVSIGDYFFKELMNKYPYFNTRSGPGITIIFFAFPLARCQRAQNTLY